MTKKEVLKRQHEEWKKKHPEIKKPDTTKQDLKISEMHSKNPFFNTMFVNAYKNFNKGSL